MYYSVEILEEFIRNQIAKPSSDTTILRSWYKYAKECPEWRYLTYGHAPAFCKLAKVAGKNINEEFGFDVIKMHFYGIWKNNEVNNPEYVPWEKDWTYSDSIDGHDELYDKLVDKALNLNQAQGGHF